MTFRGIYILYDKVSFTQDSYSPMSLAQGTNPATLRTDVGGSRRWATSLLTGVDAFIEVPLLWVPTNFRRAGFLRVRWQSESTRRGSVLFQAGIHSAGISGSGSVTLGTLTPTVYLGPLTLHETRLSLGLIPEKEDLLLVRLYRRGSLSGDSLTGTIDVNEVAFEYVAES